MEERANAAGVGILNTISCTSASDCFADNDVPQGIVIVTHNGGLSWGVEKLPSWQAKFGSPGNISCVGQRCWINLTRSNVVIATRNGGKSWSLQTLTPPCHTFICGPAYTSTDVTFVNSRDGYASGANGCGGEGATHCPGIVWRTTDGGARWRVASPGAITGSGLPAVDAISCIDASHCWAAAATFTTGEVYGTADGGARWSHQTLPRFRGFFNDIRCVRRARHDRCFAVGENLNGNAPVIVQTTDGGYRWLLDRTPRGTGPLYGVSFVGTAGRAVGLTANRSGAVALSS